MYDCNAQKKHGPSKGRAVVEGKVPPNYAGNAIELITLPLERISYTKDQPQSQKVKISDNRIKHEFLIDKPLLVFGPFLGKQLRTGYQIAAGDSIVVDYLGNKPIFSGKGSTKWELVNRLGLLEDSITKTSFYKSLSGEFKSLNSFGDYFGWNRYLNDRLNATLKLMDSYKGKISDFSYNIIKEQALYYIEVRRLERFMLLVGNAVSRDSGSSLMSNRFGLTNHDLCAIYDSTMNGPAAKWLQFDAPVVGDPYYLWERLKYDALRERNRFFKEDASDTSILGQDRVDGYVVRYELAKKRYKGIIREEVLAFFFHYVKGVIGSIGFEPEVEEILADYYKQPGFTNYKEVVREYVAEQRKKQARKRDLDFKLTDMEGNSFTKENLKGKVVVMDFWFTGCKGCAQMVPALSKVEDVFKEDTNVVFLSVSIDENKDRWLQSIRQKKYTTGNGENLYTGGEGDNHHIIRNLGIESYPSIFVMNDRGNLIHQYPKLDPRVDGGKRLIDLVKEQLVLMNDGPYIWNTLETIEISTIKGISSTKNSIDKRSSFKVATDRFGDFFTVVLQKGSREEPSVFEGAKKLFVLSDIEGNFKAFRELLQANGIIDRNYNWTFGTGHLVLPGDIFDRGEQVTECLWLIYSLEEKAKAQGGYVHYILGNHEIMNLKGDNRYVNEKYKRNAAILEKTTKELYGNNMELGRWLRTKNVVEKIGDLLFTHGGIAPEVNRLKLTLNEINLTARKYYDEGFERISDKNSKIIMSDSYSPFWYRGYYYGTLTDKHIDSTLNYYSVSHIVTGHTVVGDTISVHYGGKIINTDTRHANGKSEALLVEYGKLYRVNSLGEKVLIYNDGDAKKEDYVSF
jgi:cytochrome oxidase Cu insertion factor (SCO1/SenC/PrrC family)